MNLRVQYEGRLVEPEIVAQLPRDVAERVPPVE
jgi:hypothetical protein